MQLNDATAEAIRGHLECAVNNFIANGRWRFIDDNGPRIERVKEKEPIMWKWVRCRSVLVGLLIVGIAEAGFLTGQRPDSQKFLRIS